MSARLAARLQALAPGRARAGGPKPGDGPYTLVTTFRRDGTPVATPVWAAPDEGRLYVRSERASGKVKRLARDARVEIAACNSRGKPLGPPIAGTARVLGEAEEPAAECALARRYGLGRVLFERAVDLMRVDMCYLELRADALSRGDDADARGPSRQSPRPNAPTPEGP